MFNKQELSRIFWILGSVCAGKTTISSRIAREFNWNVYHLDEWRDIHKYNVDSKKFPNFYKESRLFGDSLWLRPVKEQIKTDEASGIDEFKMALKDIKEELKNDTRPLIFDGYAKPKIIEPYLLNKNQVFYLIAQRDFILKYYSRRPWVKDELAKTSDEKLAFENWMNRDIHSSKNLLKEVKKDKQPYLVVDGSINISETVQKIKSCFLKEN